MSASSLSEQEISEIYRQNAHGLRRFLIGLLQSDADAADCLQETFAALVQQGNQQTIATQRAWLYMVARNQAALLIRRRQTNRRALNSVQETATEHQTESDPVTAAIDQERQSRLRAAIENLPAAQRQIVELRIHDNRTFQQIAEELDIPLGTALARMRSALKKLSQRLHEP